MNLSKALECKESGNQAFQKSKYDNAIAFYSQALDYLNENDSSDNVMEEEGVNVTGTSSAANVHFLLKETCLSNRANAYFERGDYSKSNQDTESCLSNLQLKMMQQFNESSTTTATTATPSVSKPSKDEISKSIQQLQCKNKLRHARSSFYMNDWDTTMKYLQELAACDVAAYVKRSQRMICQLEFYMSNKSTDKPTSTATIPTTCTASNPPQSVLLDHDGGEGKEEEKGRRIMVPSLRPSMIDGYQEYYPFGHDELRSALRCSTDYIHQTKNTKIQFPKDNDQIIFPILFGGVGDGRHVLATILDLKYQLEQSNILNDQKEEEKEKEEEEEHLLSSTTCTSNSKGSKEQHKQQSTTTKPSINNAKFHFTMNDIKASAIARLLIQSIIFVKLGRIAPTYSCIQEEDSDARRYAALLHYMHLGFAMPPSLHALLVSIIQEVLLEYPSLGDLQVDYPWIVFTNDSDWVDIRCIMKYWADDGGNGCSSEKKKECSTSSTRTDNIIPSNKWNPIPKVSKMLGNIYVCKEVSSQDMQQTLGADMKAKTDSMMDAFADTQKQQMKDLLATLPIDDGMREKFNGAAGRELSDDELRQGMSKMIDSISSDQLLGAGTVREETKLGSLCEVVFLHTVNAMMPPTSLSCCDGEEFRLLREMKAQEKDDENIYRESSSAKQCLDGAKKIVMKTWKLNPCIIDPIWFTMRDIESQAKSIFDPIKEFFSHFVNSSVVETLMDMPDMEDMPHPRITEFFDLTSLFFWNVAHTLHTLTEKNMLCYEYNCGSILELGRDIQDANANNRDQLGWPSKFKRIYGSNIPDYTGMLPFFTEIMPLLDDPTDECPTHLYINILLNTGLWESYSQYVYSTTAIPDLSEVESLIGMKCLTPKDSSWEDHYWTWSKSSIRNQASRKTLQIWLHRLLLSILIPPIRDNHNKIRWNAPSTIVMFFRTCDFCVKVLGYPSHWIASLLDDTLKTDTLKTLAQYPQSSPNKFIPERAEQRVNVSSFKQDFQAQASLWISEQFNKGSLVVPLLETSYLPKKNTICLFQISGRIMSDLWLRTCSTDLCLGIVIEKKQRNNSPMEDLNPMNFMSMMGMDMSGRQEMASRNTFRKDVLNKGSNFCELISCILWRYGRDVENDSVSFFMSETDFETYRNQYISLVRTDGWSRVGTQCRLSDAIMVKKI